MSAPTSEPASDPAVVDAPPVARSSRITTDFEVGQLLPRAVESSGTSGLTSGKYAAAQPRGVSYSTIRNDGADRSVPSSHSLTRSTWSPSSKPSAAMSSWCTNTTRRPPLTPR